MSCTAGRASSRHDLQVGNQHSLRNSLIMQSHLLPAMCRFTWHVEHKQFGQNLPSMWNTSGQSGRCSCYQSQPNRRLQDKRAQWSQPSCHYRMCVKGYGILDLSDDTRSVSDMLRDYVPLLTIKSFYQEFLMKSMTEKYHSLSGSMDKLIANANSEVSSLREKISGRLHPLMGNHILSTL